LEVLIMDDCSPDETGQVAKLFQDPRVRYVRNDPNLGHLRNYNKGIELAKGDYIWLVSADDRLRDSAVLKRYMDIVERHPNVGYVFCPAMGLEHGQERGVEQWTFNGERDFVMSGRRFLAKLVYKNSVAAPSGMVRRECYERLGDFPLDLPYAGDWYLWCLFALHFDVAYVAEPLVNYRLHGLSMTNRLTQRHRVKDNLAVRWRIQRMASELGYQEIVKHCTASLADQYAYCMIADRFELENYAMTILEYEESLKENRGGSDHKLRGKVYAGLGDGCYKRGEWKDACRYYSLALRHEFWMPEVWAKSLLLRTGKVGHALRDIMAVSRSAASSKSNR
jgi:glycosyltransferase involved in cell wall biosynthesis